MAVDVDLVDEDGLKRKMDNMESTLKSDVMDEMDRIALDMRNKMIKSMRDTLKNTGRKYSRGGKIHHPSFPFHPPAVDSGDLINSLSIKKNLNNTELELGSNLKHARWTEMGTENMQERPWMDPVYNDFKVPFGERIARVIQNNVEREVG